MIGQGNFGPDQTKGKTLQHICLPIWLGQLHRDCTIVCFLLLIVIHPFLCDLKQILGFLCVVMHNMLHDVFKFWVQLHNHFI